MGGCGSNPGPLGLVLSDPSAPGKASDPSPNLPALLVAWASQHSHHLCTVIPEPPFGDRWVGGGRCAPTVRLPSPSFPHRGRRLTTSLGYRIFPNPSWALGGSQASGEAKAGPAVTHPPVILPLLTPPLLHGRHWARLRGGGNAQHKRKSWPPWGLSSGGTDRQSPGVEGAKCVRKGAC